MIIERKGMENDLVGSCSVRMSIMCMYYVCEC